MARWDDAGARDELAECARLATKPHVRTKALAVLNLSQGRSVTEVASFLKVNRNTVSAWRRRYEAEGLAGFELKPGRGRPVVIERDELESYLRQSPRQFGLPDTRWTLTGLVRVVPCLRGLTPSGVWRALRRYGFSYKRGQPLVYSPDPEYLQKRGG
jgi:transposase